MDEEYDNFLGIEVEFDDEENIKNKKKKKKDDFIEIDAIERTIEFIEEEEEIEAQTKRRRSTTGRGLTLINNTFDPSKILNLSLWLKADAGVSLEPPYNYVSQIVISGTSNPNFNGTYVASSVPQYIDGQLQSYNFDSPEANPTRTLRWDTGYSAFILDTGGNDVGFISADGITWDLFNQSITEVVISGFTGTYSNANGTYSYTTDYEAWLNGDFLIEVGGNLKHIPTGQSIATNGNNYQGAWTPTTYFSTITLSNAGTTYANGVYTRTDSAIDMTTETFYSGGKVIVWDGNDSFWYMDYEYYRNYSFAFAVGWSIENGDTPAPTATYAYSNRNIGSPTTTSIGLNPSGSVSGSVTTSTVTPSNVVEWADQSGNGRNGSVDSESKPLYTTINGKSFINFVAGSRLYIGSVIWPDVEFIGTIFFVSRFNSSSSGGTSLLFYQDANDGNFSFGRGTASANSFYTTKNGSDFVYSNTLAGNNTNYILATTFNAFTASLYLNGASVGSGSLPSMTGYPYNSQIGGYSTEQFNTAEVIVYNRVLTDAERQQVETYLNQKYAIY
jgi:hypothetical protein